MPQSLETFIELSHRVTSGIALIGVMIMLVWALRAYPVGHLVRKGAWLSAIFMIIEALLGAGLVLFQLTGNNDSPTRAYVIAAHLINTFILLGAITLTAWWASGGRGVRWSMLSPQLRWLFIGTFLMTALLGASGAVTALGDTLFMTSGITPEESPLVAQLIAMRVYHPLIAFATGGLLWLTIHRAQAGQGSFLRRLGNWVLLIYAGQLFVGALNVILRAPVWMQMVHLLISDIIWIGLVIFVAQRAAVPAEESQTDAPPVASSQLSLQS
jgi:heme A synthase